MIAGVASIAGAEKTRASDTLSCDLEHSSPFGRGCRFAAFHGTGESSKMIIFKAAVIVLGVGALCEMFSENFGSDLILAVVVCLS